MRNSFFFISAPVLLMICACATPYQRCAKVTDNPYGLSEDYDTREEMLADIEKIRTEKLPELSSEAAAKKIAGSVKFEWNAYGSMDACVAYKAAENRAINHQLDGLISTAGEAYSPRSAAYVDRTAESVSPVPVRSHSLTRDRICHDTCDRVSDSFACFQACR